MSRCLTFDLVAQLAALVLGVVDNGRGGGWAEQVLLDAPAVPLLPRQHALCALPLVQVVPRLRKVHVQPPCVLLIRAGAQPDPIPCGGGGRGPSFFPHFTIWRSIVPFVINSCVLLSKHRDNPAPPAAGMRGTSLLQAALSLAPMHQSSPSSHSHHPWSSSQITGLAILGSGMIGVQTQELGVQQHWTSLTH